MRWIDRTLTSLRESTVPIVPFIVDNHSTDQTVAHIQQHYPEAILVPKDHNLGFGQANNLGMKYALEHEADYVLLLNQDASIEQETIQQLLDESDGESLMTPIHMNGSGEKIDFQFSRSLHDSANGLFDDYVRGHVRKSYPITMFCAACWFLPANVVEKVGGFNPLFFHYGEDNNYYNRLTLHGIRSYVVPRARMYHDRENLGNVGMFNRKKMRREMLVAMTDQTLTTKQKMFQLYRVWGRAKSRVVPFLASLLWLLGQIGNINKSNKIEREERRAWL